ncbi:MAG: SDR family oxidoreductase, partial [Rhodospirillaceae bacterium]
RWTDTLAVNHTSVFNLMQFEIPLMQKSGGGAIVNNSSTGGMRGVKNMADYAAAKWGLVGLTKSAALDYGDDNIRVNVIAPGIITTEKAEKIQASMPELFDTLRNQIPGKRFGEMQDIANVVTWLMSDDARYVSGAVLPVDAGKTAG